MQEAQANIRLAPPGRWGFTLLEMGLVLVILSLMVSGILAIAAQNLRVEKQKELKTKMDAIETALISYRKATDRLPCPASITLADTAANFALSGTDVGSCTGGDGSTGNPAANFSSGNIVGGMVPARNLGLPDFYAYDPWGNRFMYVVDARATEVSAFTTYDVIDGFGNSITIRDGNGNVLTTEAIAAVLSFGPNGYGAYQPGGAQKSMDSSNAHELENCAGGSCAFDDGLYAHAATTSSTDALDVFDDIVRFYRREQFTSATTDTLTEIP